MKVRRAGIADWEVVRDLRLTALADAPDAFASSYEREVAFTDSVWLDRLGAEANATMLCEHDGRGCGIVTLVRDQDRSHSGWLVGMWVAPPARGTGAADLLVETLLAWAGDQRIDTVRLHVADGNSRAERLYHRHGFRRTGATLVAERTKALEIEMQRTRKRR